MTQVDHEASAQTVVRLLRNPGLASGKPVLLVGDEVDRRATIAALRSLLHTEAINVNVTLAEALIDSEQRVDPSAIIAGLSPGDGPLILDRIQILMLPQLRFNAVDVLCRVARRRPTCVSWPGCLDGGRLRYAHPDHPECLDEDVSRVTVVDLSTNEGPEC